MYQAALYQIIFDFLKNNEIDLNVAESWNNLLRNIALDYNCNTCYLSERIYDKLKNDYNMDIKFEKYNVDYTIEKITLTFESNEDKIEFMLKYC